MTNDNFEKCLNGVSVKLGINELAIAQAEKNRAFSVQQKAREFIISLSQNAEDQSLLSELVKISWANWEFFDRISEYVS